MPLIGINIVGSIIYAIVAQTTLEYLGFGDPLNVTWGTMLYNAQNSSAIIVGAWWDIGAPAAGIALVGLGLALLNFTFDEIANPQLRSGPALQPLAAPQPARACASWRLPDERARCWKSATSASTISLDKGAFRAVKNVSFEIGRGELFGLAGESGCGKSTIAYAITRLAKAPAWVAGGEILLDGQDLLKLPEAALQKVRWRRIGMVFQSAMNSLNPLMRVEAQFHDVLHRHIGSLAGAVAGARRGDVQAGRHSGRAGSATIRTSSAAACASASSSPSAWR